MEQSNYARFIHIMKDFCRDADLQVSQSMLFGHGNLTGDSNISNDDVTELDQILNENLIHKLSASQIFHTIISEENEDPVILGKKSHNFYTGDETNDNTYKYLIAIDPVDGSSNIDIGLSVGTIWGIYDIPTYKIGDKISTRNIIAAGYCLYGSCTFLVTARPGEVVGYSLDKSNRDCVIDSWVKSHPDIKMSEASDIGSKWTYAINNTVFTRGVLQPQLVDFVASLQGRMSQRFVGCMVSDIHRVLMNGGIFIYPAEQKNPCGKLRLFYEVAPMSFVVKCAGGDYILTKSHKRISSNIHARSPAMIGNKILISEYLEMLKEK